MLFFLETGFSYGALLSGVLERNSDGIYYTSRLNPHDFTFHLSPKIGANSRRIIATLGAMYEIGLSDVERKPKFGVTRDTRPTYPISFGVLFGVIYKFASQGGSDN